MFRSNGFLHACRMPEKMAWLPVALYLTLVGSQARFLDAQTLTGASVQLGRTNLSLPEGAGSIYIYGMGTGGALRATSFAQGPYAQVVDQGGQVVAGLAVTPASSNSFTTDCADFTIAGVAVSGFKTVSASYAANNQLHPRSASDGFLITDPAVAVVVAIAGGEDHLEVQGLPALQIDAQKGPDQSHGIAIVIAHASLSPGRYTVTETTEGDAGRDPAHEGDLIGVFVFTGGSGTATVVTSPPPAQGAPAPPPGASPPSGLQPPSPQGPPYAFNGARAQYEFEYGSASTPLTVTVGIPDSQPHRCSVIIQFAGPLAALSGSDELPCTNSRLPFWASPSDLRRVRNERTPPKWGASGVRHNVIVSVPAGKFVTEEIDSPEGTTWYDGRSGFLVKAQGDLLQGSNQQIPELKGVTQVIIALTATNIPMMPAPFNPLSYVWIAGLVILGALAAYGLVRMAKRRAAVPTSVPTVGRALPAVLASPGPRAPDPRSPGHGVAITTEALDKLAKLKGLLDAGLITHEDFEREKRRLLGN